MSLKKTFTDNFERNILLILIFSSATFFYLANNYESIKEYAVKFSFNKNIENAGPETLREIYDDAMSKNSSSLIEKLLEENPENSELHALAAYYFLQVDTDDYDKDEDMINKKIIFHATQAINMGSYYEPWLLAMRGRAKYILKDNAAKKDYKKAASLFEILLEASPGDANLMNRLARAKSEENGIYQLSSVNECAATYPRFLNTMQNFKQALNNSSKNDPYINMFGWEWGNLHNTIYNNLEWHARLNIGINTYGNSNYDVFKASRNCTRCNGEYVCLKAEMLSNGFCEIFSNAGEQGYEDAYDVIQKWCN